MTIDYSGPRPKDNYCEFPFEEVERYDTRQEAINAGWSTDQIWSVVGGDDEYEGDQRYISFSYGPSHHYVNLLHFVCTKEAHDEITYYHERIEMED